MGKRRDWDKIAEVVGKIKELGVGYAKGAKQFNIKVADIYEYNRQLKKGKADSTTDKSQASEIEKKSKLPDELQELIVDYRREHPDHGFKKIEHYLKSKHLVVVSRKQIRQVLKENGLLDVLDSSFDSKPEQAKGSRSFEADYPRQLYQMDVTYIYIEQIPVLYLVVIIDDYSRFVVAAELCHEQRAETLIGVLHNACIYHGKPEKLLTDQGRGFYTWSRKQTLFQHYLDEHRIEHIVSDPHSPQSQGKVERVIQTIKTELMSKVRFSGYAEARQGIVDYVKSYNFDRPHQGINGARPSDRFYGVIGETSRIESELMDKELDSSKSYLVFKVEDHQLAVVCSSRQMQVFLDGKLLQTGGENEYGQ